MAAGVRTRILFSASALALSACAADPAAHQAGSAAHRGASADYRASASARTSSPTPPPAPSPAHASRAPDEQVRPAPTVTNQASASSSSPAVAEAAGLKPERSPRPGGGLRQPSDDPASRRIAVKAGDKLSDIAHRYSVNLKALGETNHLAPPYALTANSVIYLPPPNLHIIEPGETLYTISHRFDVDTRSLALLNALERPWVVYPGDEILLPPMASDQGEAKPLAAAALAPLKPALLPTAPSVKPAEAAKAAKPAATQAPKKALLTPKSPPSSPPPTAPETLLEDKEAAAAPAAAPAVIVAAAVAPKPAPAPSGAKKLATNEHAEGRTFIWPISGPILKGFGVGPDGQNDGVNIGAPAGADVHAAAAGQVVYAGNDLAGFGNLILIRHADGWVSAYAHAERLLVREGDHVEQGQPIATAGATGSASSPQVHFELRRGKQPVDPAEYLPKLAG